MSESNKDAIYRRTFYIWLEGFKKEADIEINSVTEMILLTCWFDCCKFMEENKC